MKKITPPPFQPASWLQQTPRNNTQFRNWVDLAHKAVPISTKRPDVFALQIPLQPFIGTVQPYDPLRRISLDHGAEKRRQHWVVVVTTASRTDLPENNDVKFQRPDSLLRLVFGDCMAQPGGDPASVRKPCTIHTLPHLGGVLSGWSGKRSPHEGPVIRSRIQKRCVDHRSIVLQSILLQAVVQRNCRLPLPPVVQVTVRVRGRPSESSADKQD
mmetsp:Transcript_83247/g.222535  ORF Transcript_83247/g.222535 Transcript_83247/m.222535 type:complete len:214 (+) Transcript_83247:270-911(+)